MKQFNIFSSLVFVGTAITTNAEFTVPNGEVGVNISAYTGGWYEIASSYNAANTLEVGCECPVAYYSLNKENSSNIDVTNSCIRNGAFWKIQGSASPVSESDCSTSNLNVQFFGLPLSAAKGNYIILKTYKDEYDDYTDAVVGSNNPENWWYLSRSPWANETNFGNALLTLQSYEYNITNYRKAVQNCVFLGGHDGINLKRTS